MKMSRKMFSIAIACSFAISTILVMPVAASITVEDAPYWNGSGTSSWQLNNLHDQVTSDAYEFSKTEPIDYDESNGSVPYGYATMPLVYDTDVSMTTWFDPSDPGIFLLPGTYPIHPYFGVPPIYAPYIPYPDHVPSTPLPDVYTALYPTSIVNITNDSEHVHYPEWNAIPFSPGTGFSAWAGQILPYTILETTRQLPPIEFTEPNWNYFADRDGVKFWLKIDESYVDDAIMLYNNATGGSDPWTFLKGNNTYPFGLGPPTLYDQYLKLGHVALINASDGNSGVNLGFVADPGTGTYWITDSTFLPMVYDVQFMPGNPFAFMNPSVYPAQEALITDMIAMPGDVRNLIPATSGIAYSGPGAYNLGMDDVASITQVKYSGNSTVIAPSDYYLLDSFPQDQVVFTATLDAVPMTVSFNINNRAGLGQFNTGEWYCFEIEINWNTIVDWEPSILLKAYDHDGFIVGVWNIDTLVDDWWQTITPDMFYSEFAAPVHDGFFLPTIPFPVPLLSIEDIKCTEEFNCMVMTDVLEYVHGKTGVAEWIPSIPGSAPTHVNRTVNATFTLEYPQDMDALFDPWLSDHGLIAFDLSDPFNGSNFVRAVLVPAVMQELDDIETGTIENVTFMLLLYDGSTSGLGPPGPVLVQWLGLNDTVNTTFCVEWGPDGSYTFTATGILTPDLVNFDPGTVAYSARPSWPWNERVGSGAINVVMDGGYNVTVEMRQVAVNWPSVPAPPTLEDPELDMYHDGYTTVNLNWFDPNDPAATSYNVFWLREGDSSPSMTTRTVNDATITITATGNYSIWIIAINSSGESMSSNVKEIEVNVINITRPVLDVNVTIAGNHRSAIVTLEWTVATDADYYDVWKNTSIGPATWIKINETSDTTIAYNSTQNGTTWYKVIPMANNPLGSPIVGPASDPENATVFLAYPGTPVLSVDDAENVTRRIVLSWIHVENALHYLVYSSTNATVEIDAGHLIGNTTVTNLTYVAPTDGTYYFVVIAIDDEGIAGDQSNVVMVHLELTITSFFNWLTGIICSIITSILVLLGLAIARSRKVRERCTGGKCNVPG